MVNMIANLTVPHPDVTGMLCVTDILNVPVRNVCYMCFRVPYVNIICILVCSMYVLYMYLYT